jgi:hypothetical protein
MRLTTLLLLCSILVGCSTYTGVADPELGVIKAPSTYLLKKPVPESISRYEPEFEKVMNEFGLYKGETGDPLALVLTLEYNPNPFVLQVKSAVTQKDRLVARGEATNPGFGTVIAKSAVISDLVLQSALSLQGSLHLLGDRLVVAEDVRHQQQAIQQGGKSIADEINDLEDLRQRGILTDEEFKEQKKKALSQ